MSTDFWSVLDDETVETEAEARSAAPRHELRCDGCGRFAVWVGDQHYYNGQFDCYRYTIRCSRCGDVDVECV